MKCETLRRELRGEVRLANLAENCHVFAIARLTKPGEV
jgi:hypothetical protein